MYAGPWGIKKPVGGMFGGKSPPAMYVLYGAKIGQEIESGKKYGEKIKIE